MICFNSCTLGIDENKMPIDLKLYPNPAANNLNILSEQNQFQYSEIEIINYLGQTVLKTQYTNTIDVSKLSKGIYTLKIIAKEN
ncbi:MAG TPA: T9SS type A sorting domain-containing protein [Bacteroidia bacterium]|jgi:hypothetical protein|nr:T9SS type A sorting domain-containing protein [Bacteroidia bacterium]